MWPGIVILLILVSLLFFLKSRPKTKPQLTDAPDAPHLPNPFLMGNDLNVMGGPPMVETATWAQPRTRTPISRPVSRGRDITIPMIRWAQAQYERGQDYAMHPRALGQRFDDSYWRAVEILRSVQGGGFYLAPSSNAAPATFERYHPPFGQTLPIRVASPVESHTQQWNSQGVPYATPATAATILMSAH